MVDIAKEDDDGGDFVEIGGGEKRIDTSECCEDDSFGNAVSDNSISESDHDMNDARGCVEDPMRDYLSELACWQGRNYQELPAATTAFGEKHHMACARRTTA